VKNVVCDLCHIALSMKLNQGMASQIALREIAEFSRVEIYPSLYC
jgi:hypothetical protein